MTNRDPPPRKPHNWPAHEPWPPLPTDHPLVVEARRHRRVAILVALGAAGSVITSTIVLAGFYAQMQFIRTSRDIIKTQDAQIAELRARVTDLERGKQ